jgi:hypothetical protein
MSFNYHFDGAKRHVLLENQRSYASATGKNPRFDWFEETDVDVISKGLYSMQRIANFFLNVPIRELLNYSNLGVMSLPVMRYEDGEVHYAKNYNYFDFLTYVMSGNKFCLYTICLDYNGRIYVRGCKL